MITTDIKKQIITALASKRDLFSGSDAKFSTAIGINSSQYSRIKNGDFENVVSDSAWISLARICDVQLGNSIKWNTAKTPFFEFVTAQLTFCQENSASRILCDVADIGKTHTATYYASTHKNVVYVDCSQVKTKQKLIRKVAKELGVRDTSKYSEVYADLVYYIRSLSNVLIILDEVGDLDYPAFLECKALWNATEGVCGWYMMGADGLRHKIDTRIEHRKVGYTEIFSRYGNKYQKATPDSEKELKSFKIAHAAMIVAANFPTGTNVSKVIAAADFTLRNLKDERKKLVA